MAKKNRGVIISDMRETMPHIESESESEGISVGEALSLAGLSEAHAPKEGTPAYDRLVAAARNYMREVKAGLSVQPFSGDSENYVPPEKREKKRISSSDTMRRAYHDQLTHMLLGQQRKGLRPDLAHQVANFAAYFTGDEDFVGKW